MRIVKTIGTATVGKCTEDERAQNPNDERWCVTFGTGADARVELFGFLHNAVDAAKDGA